MCRSIRTLRPPFADEVTHEDIRAAALQYVRKVSGFRTPANANVAAFDGAVEAVADATSQLLATLKVRPAAAQAPRPTAQGRASRYPGRVP